MSERHGIAAGGMRNRGRLAAGMGNGPAPVADAIPLTYFSNDAYLAASSNIALMISTVRSTSTWPPSGPTSLLWTTAL